jgi:hypothetical protein
MYMSIFPSESMHGRGTPTGSMKRGQSIEKKRKGENNDPSANCGFIVYYTSVLEVTFGGLMG